MISTRFRYGLSSELSEKIQVVLNRTAHSIVDGEGKPLDAAPLYTYLFGNLTPVTINYEWPPAMQETMKCIDSMAKLDLPEMDVKSIKLLVPVRSYPARAPKPPLEQEWLSIPTKQRCQDLGMFTKSSIYGSNYLAFESHDTEVPAALINRVRRGIYEVWGEEVLEAIDRVAEITHRLRNLDQRVDRYIPNVKSEGALFKMLPPLLSLSRKAINVRHIKVTREAIPPTPELLADLNLLASLFSAGVKQP